VNPKLRAQVGMPIRDHVDPFDRRNLLDILQALERLDRRAYDDVLVGPRCVFGRAASGWANLKLRRECWASPIMSSTTFLGAFAPVGARLAGE
jgi:hypothetical protein